MIKLKALFNKLKPKSPVAIAIVQTVLYLLAFIVGLVILITNPDLFILVLIFGLIVFIIKELFFMLLRKAIKKTERKMRR